MSKKQCSSVQRCLNSNLGPSAHTCLISNRGSSPHKWKRKTRLFSPYILRNYGLKKTVLISKSIGWRNQLYLKDLRAGGSSFILKIYGLEGPIVFWTFGLEGPVYFKHLWVETCWNTHFWLKTFGLMSLVIAWEFMVWKIDCHFGTHK